MKLRRDQLSLHLRTSRDGVLSPLGHDLDLIVEEVDVTRTDDNVEVVVDAASVRVHGVMKNEALVTNEPSQKDRTKIESNIQSQVLSVKRHAQVRFQGKLESERLVGELTLCGVTKPFTLHLRDGVWVGVVHQPDFGIEPYSALLGQLRVAPDVVVRASVAQDSL